MYMKLNLLSKTLVVSAIALTSVVTLPISSVSAQIQQSNIVEYTSPGFIQSYVDKGKILFRNYNSTINTYPEAFATLAIPKNVSVVSTLQDVTRNGQYSKIRIQAFIGYVRTPDGSAVYNLYTRVQNNSVWDSWKDTGITKMAPYVTFESDLILKDLGTEFVVFFKNNNNFAIVRRSIDGAVWSKQTLISLEQVNIQGNMAVGKKRIYSNDFSQNNWEHYVSFVNTKGNLVTFTSKDLTKWNLVDKIENTKSVEFIDDTYTLSQIKVASDNFIYMRGIKCDYNVSNCFWTEWATVFGGATKGEVKATSNPEEHYGRIYLAVRGMDDFVYTTTVGLYSANNVDIPSFFYQNWINTGIKTNVDPAIYFDKNSKKIFTSILGQDSTIYESRGLYDGFTKVINQWGNPQQAITFKMDHGRLY